MVDKEFYRLENMILNKESYNLVCNSYNSQWDGKNIIYLYNHSIHKLNLNTNKIVSIINIADIIHTVNKFQLINTNEYLLYNKNKIFILKDKIKTEEYNIPNINIKILAVDTYGFMFHDNDKIIYYLSRITGKINILINEKDLQYCGSSYAVNHDLYKIKISDIICDLNITYNPLINIIVNYVY